ncbi:single-stranded DNA-binding protein [Stieleria sp. JC731]|uniref:uracil-DNA glycosylase family protein n=1 Tax=Pirellulaceae TaxID=2691357 RepID=UPI001E4D1792|nr:uracil-DNA glycosylase family protein [Stieleria sp. JC731]MCC9598935.1 single-stranded DNA-binding protein [Stieleria sp. JC731]
MNSKALIKAARKLSKAVDELHFDEPVTHVYNPLAYARKSHEAYLSFVGDNVSVVFLGMNPGPWGMAQTGVPFGEIAAVRDWMKIDQPIGKPAVEHEKRPVEGLSCSRSEVSGRRLWGLFQERFGSPKAFFKKHFVLNYCPLVFMESSARNRTPDKLPAAERAPLDAVCDDHLRSVLKVLAPQHAVGVGAYAEACLKRVVADLQSPPQVSRILHPSPASPAANRDWAGTATKQLSESGIW